MAQVYTISPLKFHSSMKASPIALMPVVTKHFLGYLHCLFSCWPPRISLAILKVPSPNNFPPLLLNVYTALPIPLWLYVVELGASSPKQELKKPLGNRSVCYSLTHRFTHYTSSYNDRHPVSLWSYYSRRRKKVCIRKSTATLGDLQSE